MELSDALQQMLVSDTTLNTDLQGRVYVGKVPEKRKYPLALLHMAEEDSQPLLEGGTCGILEQQVQLDFYAEDKLAIDRLRKQLRTLMPCARKIVTVGGAQYVLDGIVDFRVEMANVWEAELELWRCITDFTVFHTGGGNA